MKKGIALCLGLGLLATSVQSDRVRAPSAVKFNFPCDIALANVARIWIDDESFWDSANTGFIEIAPCEPLELYSLVWYESIVIEYVVWKKTDPIGKFFRIRLFPDGTIVPELKVPESTRLDT